MLITGLYDKLAGKYVQFIPTINIGVLRRDFKNTMKAGSIYYESADDFSVYILAEIDETTGQALPKHELAFELALIKDDPQVQ